MQKQNSYTIPIKIKLEGQEPITFYFDSQTTFKSIIASISSQTLLNPQDILLTIEKTPIVKTQKTLSQMKIKNYSTINVQCLESKGGGMVSFKFNNLNKEDRIVRNFSSSAPQYRIATSGLNLQSRCITQSCKAFGNYVIIQKGFGKFNIGRQIYQCVCPLCHKETDPAQKIGYSNTKLIIKGRLSNKDKIQREEQADNHYVTYKGQASQMTNWGFLQIQAKEKK